MTTLYFGKIISKNDPDKAGRYRVKIEGIDGETANTRWLFASSTNSSHSSLYHDNDRVVVYCFDPEKETGLIIGKVPVKGFKDDVSPFVNPIEQGLIKGSSFKMIDINLSSYPDVITTIYNKSVCLFNDLIQIGIMHSKGALFLLDKMANIILKTDEKIEAEAKKEINLSILPNIKFSLSTKGLTIKIFAHSFEINNTSLSIKVGTSALKMTPTSVDISIGSSKIQMTPAFVKVNGAMIYLN